MHERTCPYCSGEFQTSHPHTVTCGSAECRQEHQRTRCREWQRSYAEKNGQWANAKHRPRKTGTSCVDCGAPTRGGRSAETRCRKCGQRRNSERRTAERREQRERELAEYNSRSARARRGLAKAAEGVSRGWVFVSGPCHSCGTEFTCQLMKDPAKYCSKTCSKREARAIRRALELGVKITPGRRHAVFVRDGWTCRICGDPVNRDAQVPELDAPTIDHIVPLARGGAHAPENWQTAHYYCNSYKRDQIGIEFAEEA